VHGAKLTELNNVTQKMLGTSADRKLKTKAGETWGLLLFLVQVLSIYPAIIADQQRLLEAGSCLSELIHLFDSCGSRMPAASVQLAFDKFLRHMALTADFDDLLIPKRHLVLHMLRDIPWLGNPKHYACWEDESLNKTLKKACRGISQQTFEASVLISMRQTLNTMSLKRKRD
jgi:hypothetical protein